jgi:ssDNA-binding Zn-finger/Zn-ribbon topoisomerase 1
MEKTKPIPPPKCSNCGKRMDVVYSNNNLTFVWKGEGDIGHYEEDLKQGDAEEHCPHCNMKYPCAKTGEASCVDVQKIRRGFYSVKKTAKKRVAS